MITLIELLNKINSKTLSYKNIVRLNYITKVLNEGVIKLPQILQDASYQIVDMLGEKVLEYLVDKSILQELNDEFNKLLEDKFLPTIKLIIDKHQSSHDYLSSMDEIFIKHKIQPHGYFTNMSVNICHFNDKRNEDTDSSHIIIKKDVLEITYSTVNEIRIYYSDDFNELLENFNIPYIQLFKSNTVKVFDELRVESNINMNIMRKLNNEFPTPITFKLVKQNPNFEDKNFRGRIVWVKSDNESKSVLQISYFDIDDLLKKFTINANRNEVVQTIQHELIHYYDYINSQKGKTFDVTNVVYQRQQWLFDEKMVTTPQSKSNMQTILYYTSDNEMQTFSNNFSNAIISHYVGKGILHPNKLIQIIDNIQRNFTDEMKKLNRTSTNPDLVDGIGSYLTISKLTNYKIPMYNRNDFMQYGTKTRKNKIINGDKIWMKLRGYIVERLNDKIKSLKSDDSIIQNMTKVNPKYKYEPDNTDVSNVDLNKKSKQNITSIYNKLVEFLYNNTSKIKSNDDFISYIMDKYNDDGFGKIFDSNERVVLLSDYDDSMNDESTFFKLENRFKSNKIIFIVLANKTIEQTYNISQSDFEVLCGSDIKKIAQEIISQS